MPYNPTKPNQTLLLFCNNSYHPVIDNQHTYGELIVLHYFGNVRHKSATSDCEDDELLRTVRCPARLFLLEFSSLDLSQCLRATLWNSRFLGLLDLA